MTGFEARRQFTMVALLVALAASSARAQVYVERIELANQSIKVESQSSVAGLGLRCHIVQPMPDGDLRIVPVLEYWRDSDRFPEFGIEHVSQRDWTFGTEARYRFLLQRSWRPYVGGGLGLHFLESTFKRIGEPEQSDHPTRLGMNVLVGVDLPAAGRLLTSVEMTYHVVSHFGQFKINWGLGIKL